MGMIRLDKFLCQCLGISRKEAKEKIKSGQIEINGETIKRADYKVSPQRDRVVCQGENLSYEPFHYLMLHKPQGIVSATKDSSEITVIDLIDQPYGKNLFPVGRLDKDTEGLILLTDDGDLAHNLMSPRKHVKKTYYAEVSGAMGEAEIAAFAGNLDIGGGESAKPAVLEVLDVSKGISKVRITITEGKFHQIKRMVKAVGSEVLFLKRLSIGSLTLPENLPVGSYRKLTEEELQRLKEPRC